MRAQKSARRRCVIKNDIVEELFAKYYNELLLYMLAICRDEHIAEDVVSTAFFKALQSAEDSVKDFKLWLLAVCRNEYFTLCRKKKRFSEVPLDERTADNSCDVLERIIRDDEYRALYRAISLLPPEQKEVITLFYFSAVPVRSIAGIMGKSESNIKVMLHRARINLKSILEVT